MIDLCALFCLISAAIVLLVLLLMMMCFVCFGFGFVLFSFV